ncbi:MAG: AhpC/TSA family protein [Sphingobacteriales bacterium]|nr:MAG: AhpC/TSA family protein [Sphingobacteriales bacterium]
MRSRALVILWLAALFAAVVALFWRNELVYNLPTPVPSQYTKVEAGNRIYITAFETPENTKPLFIHFFNPDCPCSRFNMNHFKSIVKEYNTQVDFAMVVLSADTYTAAQIKRKYDLDMPVYFDSAMAAACGVYSTPQAVILNTDHQLVYRGNYNKSRYCTDKKTEYARLALSGLLQNKTYAFNQFALKAYGCQLPKCTK